MKGDYKLINLQDTADGRQTTILIQRTTFPDAERTGLPRDSKHLIIHQITGTYQTIEDFNHEWQDAGEPVENIALCPKCKEPVTYFTPNLGELVNFTCMKIEDAKALNKALNELLQEASE